MLKRPSNLFKLFFYKALAIVDLPRLPERGGTLFFKVPLKKKLNNMFKLLNIVAKPNGDRYLNYFNKYAQFLPFFKRVCVSKLRSKTIFFFKKTINTFKFLKTALSRIVYGRNVKTLLRSKLYISSLSNGSMLKAIKRGQYHPVTTPTIFFSGNLSLLEKSEAAKKVRPFVQKRPVRRGISLGLDGLRVLTFSNARYGRKEENVRLEWVD